MSFFNLTKEQLPLKEMGESLLLFEIQERSKTLHFDNKVEEAAILASFLHRNQRRQNRGDLPKDTYIVHPYRNALRLLRWGVRDQDTIVATILHDTFEDCAEEMARLWKDNTTEDMDYIHRGSSTDDLALLFLVENFGPSVAAIIKAVSNPRIDPSLGWSKEEEHESYRDHVIEAINSSIKVAQVKASDYADNALSLHHNTGNPKMQRSLARKYLPLLDHFINIIESPEMKAEMSITGWTEARKKFSEGRERLIELADL